MAAVFVHPEVELVDLDLANSPHRRAQVILEAEGGENEEDVDQAVVADDGEQCLLVVKRIRARGRGDQ